MLVVFQAVDSLTNIMVRSLGNGYLVYKSAEIQQRSVIAQLPVWGLETSVVCHLTVCCIRDILSSQIHRHTNILIWKGRVLLDRLTSPQLIKKSPQIHGTRKVHYRIHNSPPPVPLLNQINAVHVRSAS